MRKKKVALMAAGAALSAALLMSGSTQVSATEGEAVVGTEQEVVDEEKLRLIGWNDGQFDYYYNTNNTTNYYISSYIGTAAQITVPAIYGEGAVLHLNGGAFYNKDHVTSVTLEEGHTVVNNGTFENCDALKTVNLPSTITAIGEKAFYNCPSLTEITIPDGVTSIGAYAFANCASLTEIEIPDTVTMISSNAFNGCTSLEKIVLPDTVSVIDVYAFANCTSLEEITFPDGITTIKGGAFENCTALTEVTVPKSVISFGNSVFDGCSDLESLTLNAKITTVPAMKFDTMTSLETFVMPADIKDIPNNYFKNATTIKSVTLPEKLATIGEAAFYGCSSLESIELPEGLKTINKHTFYGCTNLESVNIPDTVTTIGEGAFELSGLTGITIPESVTSMGKYTFQKCADLKEAVLLTKIEVLPDYFMNECISLESITLPDTLKRLENCAFSKTALTEFTSPAALEYIDFQAFYDCDKLTSVTLEKPMAFLGTEVFSNCDALTSVIVKNAECVLEEYKDSLGTGKTTVIYGYADSTAQTYAENHEMTFCDIEEMARREQVSAFATRMYTVVLNRDADPVGLTDWTNWLLDHTVDGAGIAEGFFLSKEFVDKNVSNEEYVNILYRTFFDREADADGRATWMGLLTEGKSRKSVLAGFVNSNEFDALCTSYGIVRGTMVENEAGETTRTGVDGFLERLYSKVLKRNPDAEGMSTWKNLIVSGQMTAEEAAKSFFFSDEFIARGLSDADYVDTLYQTFMGRTADEAGKTMWVGLLAEGMTRQEVLEGFSRSDEFKAILVSFGL